MSIIPMLGIYEVVELFCFGGQKICKMLLQYLSFWAVISKSFRHSIVASTSNTIVISSEAVVISHARVDFWTTLSVNQGRRDLVR